MNSITKKYFFGAFAFSLSLSSIVASIDDRLVGNWQGQRDQEGMCSFMAWKMSRTADGRFEIVFYGDAEKKKMLREEKGRWEVSDGKLSVTH